MHVARERILLGSAPALRWMPRPASASRAERSPAQRQPRPSSQGTAGETTPAARNGHGRSRLDRPDTRSSKCPPLELTVTVLVVVLALTRARQSHDGCTYAEILDRARPDN